MSLSCFFDSAANIQADMMEEIFFEVTSGHRGQSCSTENPEKSVK